jgi:hypothetical protein
MKLPRRKFLHLAAGGAALPAVSRIARASLSVAVPIKFQSMMLDALRLPSVPSVVIEPPIDTPAGKSLNSETVSRIKSDRWADRVNRVTMTIM